VETQKSAQSPQQSFDIGRALIQPLRDTFVRDSDLVSAATKRFPPGSNNSGHSASVQRDIQPRSVLGAGQRIVIGKIAVLRFHPQLCGAHVLERPHESQRSIRNNGVIGDSSLSQELPDSAAPTLKATWLTLAWKRAYCVQTHSANVAFLPCLLHGQKGTTTYIFGGACIATYSRGDLVDCFSRLRP
jgi:hypothetical protein